MTGSMADMILEDLEGQFPGKAFISAKEICDFMGCEMTVVYNWNKRCDLRRRPPCVSVGKELRFQKRLFARWLAQEQEMKTVSLESRQA